MSVRFEMRLPDEMARAIDVVRGNEPRAAWIKRTLSMALTMATVSMDDADESPVRTVPSSPRRAPVAPKDDAATWAMDRQAKLNAAKYGGKA